jgi:hypothetical protein
VLLSLALDAKDEGPWDSPLASLGKLLATNVNKTIPIPALVLPGVAFILLFLLFIHAHRGLAHLSIDRRDRAPSADVFPWTLLLSGGTVMLVFLDGMRTGGDGQMAKIQVQSFIMMLVVAYLTAVSFRGMRDYRALGVVIIVAAVIKSVMAMYVAAIAPTTGLYTDGELQFAITHGESLLFAAAAVLLLVRLAESPSARTLAAVVVILPIIVLGMSANNRRLVYVEVAVALLLYWMVSRRSDFKRLVARTLLAALPLILVYVAAGWNSHSKIFAPVKIFRSVEDSNVDHSTLYRDLENYDLLATIRFNPVFGPGFGHPFAEVVKLPDISFFREYRYMPHNSLLGLWAFCGPMGFTGLMLALVAGMYLAAIAYRAAPTGAERTAAFMCLGMIVIYLVHCWGDIGFTERKAIYLLGPALGIAAQLAATTGAWPARPRRRHA